MPASAAQQAERARNRDAAITMRRAGMSAAEVAAALHLKDARRVRELTKGIDFTQPPPSAKPQPAGRPKRKAPRRKRPPRSQKGLGHMLPIIVLPPARRGQGGFGLPPVELDASGLGENPAIGESASYARGVKLSEQVVDMGTTVQHDARRYAGPTVTEYDPDDIPDEVPEGTRVFAVLDNGITTEIDLT